MSNAGKRIQPFYLVFDTSGPIESSLHDLGDEFLRRFFRTVASDPIVDEWLRARVVQLGNSLGSPGLIQLSNCLGVPQLTVEPFISLTQELSQLKKFIEDDLTELRNDDCSVFRPVMLLFLSGDFSGEDWANEFRQLSDRLTFRFAPNVFVFTSETKNVSDLSELLSDTEDSVGIRSAYVLEQSHDVEPVARIIVDHFVMNVVRLHVNAWIDGRPPFPIPDSLPGIRKIDADLLVDLSSGMGSAEEVDADEEALSVDNGQGVIPFYVAFEESASVDSVSIDACNRAIMELLNEIASDPILDEKTHISIISFSNSAEVLLPMSEVRELKQVPGCVASTKEASHASVFRLLKTQIENDVLKLASLGYRVHRPFVFLLTSGIESDEDWRSPLLELVDKSFQFRPHIATFGWKGANTEFLIEVSTALNGSAAQKSSFAFLMEDEIPMSALVREIFRYQIDPDSDWPYVAPKRPNDAPRRSVPIEYL
jgi:uncharacterized protein YegL